MIRRILEKISREKYHGDRLDISKRKEIHFPLLYLNYKHGRGKIYWTWRENCLLEVRNNNPEKYNQHDISIYDWQETKINYRCLVSLLKINDIFFYSISVTRFFRAIYNRNLPMPERIHITNIQNRWYRIHHYDQNES